jgi:nucleotide-binding universal stress UspA family protein
MSEARRRWAPLRVVAARGSMPHLPAPGGHARGPVPDTLRTLSVDAAVLVVPATLPGIARITAESHCPVVAVPEHGPGRTGKPGRVVLGAAPWTGSEVFELAFAAAADRRTGLIAVRTWTDPLVDLASLRPEQLHAWDQADLRARHELDHALSAWTVTRPDVPVEKMVVCDRPTAFLITLSHRARLLVLGRSRRGAELGLIAGSPAEELLRAARCPVLVVPPAGAPHRTWPVAAGTEFSGCGPVSRGGSSPSRW